MRATRIDPTDRSTASVEHIALALAGHGFSARGRLPTQPLSDGEFSELLRTVEAERLLGTMAEAVVDDALVLTKPQLEALAGRHELWSRHALDVEALLIDVRAVYAQAGIEFRVLKGVALAHVAYANPSFRVFGDLDLLVPADRFDEAVRLTGSALGGTQWVPELRAGFDHEFGKEALVRVGRIEVDLHRTFVTGPFGLTIDLDQLFAASTPIVIGGHEFHALERVPLLLHACYNAALGDFPPRLGALRDLAIVSEIIGSDSAEVRAMAREWGAGAVVRRAAQLTVEGLRLGADHPLTELTRIPVRRRERWLLRSYVTPARSYSRPLASLAVIPGVSARVRYARALLSPSAEYLGSRGWTERRHLARARDRLFRRG